MAKYEDYAKKYAKKTDALEEQIEDAAKAEKVRAETPVENTFQMPERFKNKSAEEIARAYSELEKLNSRQSQDLGQMRSLVDQLIQQESGNPSQEQPSDEPVNFDSLYDDPEAAIQKVVAKHPAVKKLDDLERQLEEQRISASRNEFAEKHPDFQEIAQDAAFLNWVQESPTRLDLAKRADGWDLHAADALFTLYKAENKSARSSAREQRDRKLTEATLEASVASSDPAPRSFSRSEWLQQLTRAKQGDLQAQDYINKNSAAYRKALGSGNVRD